MNILVAVDGSEAALQACRLVAQYARTRPALHIHLINVQRAPLRLSPHPGIEQSVLEEALQQQGHQHLDAARALLPPDANNIRSVVRIGRPAETLLDEARSCGAQALVIGSGRRGLLGGYAVGSVALRVAPAASCPVVLVRADARLMAGDGETLRVTAPVDGSVESINAVRRLAECAALLGPMHVDLVHFRAGLTLAGTMLAPREDVIREWGSLETDAALREPARLLESAAIPHTLHRLSGAAETEIAAFAKQHAADLIAMGTRGSGAMHHLFLGSAALRTAHLSEVPVALMR